MFSFLIFTSSGDEYLLIFSLTVWSHPLVSVSSYRLSIILWVSLRLFPLSQAIPPNTNIFETHFFFFRWHLMLYDCPQLLSEFQIHFHSLTISHQYDSRYPSWLMFPQPFSVLILSQYFPSLNIVTGVTQGSSSFLLMFFVHQDLLILFVVFAMHLIT